MYPSNAGLGSLGGPSKRTRKSTRKKVARALGDPVPLLANIIHSTTKASKEVENIIKELL